MCAWSWSSKKSKGQPPSGSEQEVASAPPTPAPEVLPPAPEVLPPAPEVLQWNGLRDSALGSVEAMLVDIQKLSTHDSDTKQLNMVPTIEKLINGLKVFPTCDKFVDGTAEFSNPLGDEGKVLESTEVIAVVGGIPICQYLEDFLTAPDKVGTMQTIAPKKQGAIRLFAPNALTSIGEAKEALQKLYDGHPLGKEYNPPQVEGGTPRSVKMA